jgi:clan AA aspartic protease (TIGR02281 family)
VVSAVSPGGQESEVAVARHRNDGRAVLTLASDVPAGSAILDADQHVVGLALGGREALALDLALPLLRPLVATRPLADVQAELRQQDPSYILRDAAALMNEPTTAARVKEALDKLELGFALARSAALLEQYDETLRYGHHLLVQKTAADDPAAAAALARRALDRFPQHAGILGDLVQLTASLGDVLGAADLYMALRHQSRERAEELAGRFAGELASAGSRHLTERRPSEAYEVFSRGVDLFPQDARLRRGQAQALARLEELADTAAGARVEIPIDPGTHSVRATCTVGGEPLEFIVDTGASYTVIPAAFARHAVEGLRRPVTVQTAGGAVTGTLIRVPDLRIGDIRLSEVTAVALDLPGTLSGKGLLGLNVLRRLHMQVDDERSVIVLRSRRR